MDDIDASMRKISAEIRAIMNDPKYARPQQSEWDVIDEIKQKIKAMLDQDFPPEEMLMTDANLPNIPYGPIAVDEMTVRRMYSDAVLKASFVDMYPYGPPQKPIKSRTVKRTTRTKRNPRRKR